MAPPHAIQKANNAKSEATSRGGTRQVDNGHIEEFEEEDLGEIREADDMDTDADTEDLTGDIQTETSQDANPSNPVQQLLKDMQADQHKRNEIRKKGVYNTYAESRTSTQDAVKSYFDDHEAAASQAHEAQMTRLRDLLKMKAEIEAAMTQRLDDLRQDYLFHSNAIEKVIEHRMERES